MKKVLLLAGLMAVSSMALGAGEIKADQSNGWAPEVDVIVKAQVVENLTIKATDVDFGTLIKGQQNKAQAKAGVVTVTGEAERNIKFTITDDTDQEVDLATAKSNGFEVTMKNQGAKAQMPATLKIDKVADTGVNVLTSGTFEFNITGTTSAAVDQALGDYNTTIKVKAQYE